MPVKDLTQNESYFENIFKNYDDEVNKIFADHQVTRKNQMYIYYMELIDGCAAQVGLKVRSDLQARRLAVAICFNLEDNNAKEVGSEWIIENYDRNPEFYGTIFVGRTSEDQKTPEPEHNKDYVAQPVVEAEDLPVSDKPADLDLVDSVIRLKQVRERQLKEMIDEVTKKFISSDFATTADVVSVMGENKALREMLVAIFERAEIVFSTTVQGSLPLETYTKKTPFKQGIPYTLEHLKFGFSNFSIMIDEKRRMEAERTELKTQIKVLEAKNAQAISEATRLRTNLETLGQDLEALQNTPKLSSAKPLQYRIAWDEEGERYYLGTSAEPEDVNEKGLYKVKSLIKSTSKRDSLIFKDLDLLQAQLQRAVQNYKFINRKQLISLVHLQTAYVVETLEHVNIKAARKPAVQKSISTIGKK